MYLQFNQGIPFCKQNIPSGPGSVYDKWNISVVICNTDIPQWLSKLSFLFQLNHSEPLRSLFVLSLVRFSHYPPLVSSHYPLWYLLITPFGIFSLPPLVSSDYPLWYLLITPFGIFNSFYCYLMLNILT
jgi:hypothetical protein